MRWGLLSLQCISIILTPLPHPSHPPPLRFLTLHNSAPRPLLPNNPLAIPAILTIDASHTAPTTYTVDTIATLATIVAVGAIDAVAVAGAGRVGAVTIAWVVGGDVDTDHATEGTCGAEDRVEDGHRSGFGWIRWRGEGGSRLVF